MIIDANVAVKWVLDHPDNALASALMGRPDLKAPSNLLLEVAHVLTREKRERGLPERDMRDGWALIVGGNIAITPFEGLLEEALNLSLRLNATTHDCLYMALALREDDTVMTADRRMRNAAESVADTRGLVMMLGDA